MISQLRRGWPTGCTPPECLLEACNSTNLAFFESLLAELSYAAATATQGDAAASKETAEAQDDRKPLVYPIWHGHLSALLAAQRPDIDAGLTAHLVLGALHSEPILARLTGDGSGEGPGEVAAAMRAMARSILDAPRVPDGTR